MNRKIAIITGAGGMDARTLTRFLINKNYHVILTYRRNTQLSIEKIAQEFQEILKNNGYLTFEVCDITDKSSVDSCIKNVLKQFNKIDELYMLASMSHVGMSFHQKDYSIICNGQSYYYFLESVKNYTPKTRVYGALTSELAGNVPEGILFNETSSWNPKSPYSCGKALGGHWIKFYRESTDSQLFCCFGILFNHSNCLRRKDFLIRKVTNTFANIALGKEKELRLGHLNFARDEHWSDFGCEMMWKMLQQDTPKDYVIGNGETHWGEEYLNIVGNFFNLNWEKHVVFDKDFIRPNEVVRLVADSREAQKDLGWKPNRMSFKQHLELMCNYDYLLEQGKKPELPDVFMMFPSE